jgi:glycosyltransferase involved in cell wall biosynthesis
MIPLLVLETIRLIRKRHADVMMTIAHGNFFIATALAGWVTRTPYVVVMHDDTVTRTVRRPPIPHCFFQPLVRQALGRAAHVYAISSGMQKLLKSAYGVDSELQLPATEINRRDATVGALNPLNSNSSAILFAGTITRSVEGSIRLLAETLVAGKLKLNCILPPQLHLYTKLSDQKIRDWGWVDPSIRVHDWVPQEQLRRVLQSADILFLPFSFSEEVRHAVETAFPSKTADYLASGKPILVFGPSYSTLVRYASEQGFAEVVTEFSADALMHGIQKILLSSAYRERLVARALEVLSQYHDIKRQRNQFRSVLSALAKRNHA